MNFHSEIPPSKTIIQIFEDLELLEASISSHLPTSEAICLAVNNPSATIIIIKNMCLGIILPDHFANKFKYIQNLHLHDGYQTHPKYNIKIIFIDDAWDTSNWSYQKLKSFTFRISDIEQLNMKQIYKLPNWQKQHHDLNFLEALCWCGNDNEEDADDIDNDNVNSDNNGDDNDNNTDNNTDNNDNTDNNNNNNFIEFIDQ